MIAGVLRGRAHRLAVTGRLDEPPQENQDRDGHQHGEQLTPLVGDVADLEDIPLGDQRWDAAVVHAEDRERDVLDDERHAHRGNQDRQARGLTKAPVRHELDGGVQQCPEGDDNYECRQQAGEDPEYR
jgi:hypothetical protein